MEAFRHPCTSQRDPPDAKGPRLLPVGPRQTVSLSDPSFHHFTRKDLKVLQRCRPARLRPEGEGASSNLEKEAGQPLASPLPAS